MGKLFADPRPHKLEHTTMKSIFLAGAALIGLLDFSNTTVNAADMQGTVLHDPAPAVDDSKAAATRVMNVLIADGLIAGEEASALRTELGTIFEKSPKASGDAAKDAVTQQKVKDQVQAAVVKHVGKEKSARVSELLAKPEAWDAKTCAKGKACCSGHK